LADANQQSAAAGLVATRDPLAHLPGAGVPGIAGVLGEELVKGAQRFAERAA